MPKKIKSRIYYGTERTKLWWTVNVSDAKQSVTINGNLMDALRGTPGVTIGCHLSYCALRNSNAFPHPVYFASFTKRVALIVDRVANGAPSHAIRYHHEYGDFVDLNDTDQTKMKIKSNPHLVERSFTLRKPFKRRAQGPRAYKHGKDTGENSQKITKGALARARKAGLITADLANAVR